jgi:5-methylcytosine-specific restriction endonuclease McrA
VKKSRDGRLVVTSQPVPAGTCFYCDVKLIRSVSRKGRDAPPNAWTRDHIYPRTHKINQTVAGNTVAACATCNNRKGHLDPLDWLVIMPHQVGARRLYRRLLEMGAAVSVLDECMARRKR